MFPQGIAFIGGNWHSIESELVQIGQKGLNLMRNQLDGILLSAESSPEPFEYVRENGRKLFEELLEERSLLGPKVNRIIHVLRFYCLDRCDHLIGQLFLTLSEFVGPELFYEACPIDWKGCWEIINPVAFSALDELPVRRVVDLLKRATCFCSVNLRAYNNCNSTMRLKCFSSNLFRLAVRLAVDSITNVQQANFDCALQFLVVFEADDFGTYRLCVTFFIETLFNSLRSVYLLLDAIRNDNKPSDNSHPQASVYSLIELILEELRELQSMCDTLPEVFGPPTTETESKTTLSVLVFLLFDRLLAVLLVHTGLTSNIASSLWHLLYKNSCKSVESWARFFLSPKMVYD